VVNVVKQNNSAHAEKVGFCVLWSITAVVRNLGSTPNVVRTTKKYCLSFFCNASVIATAVWSVFWANIISNQINNMKKYKVWICSSLDTIWKGTELDWDAMIKEGCCHYNIIMASSEFSALFQCKEYYPYCQFKVETI
jgi:hypothetical protein